MEKLHYLTYPTNKKINTECLKNSGVSYLDLTYYDHSMDGADYDEDLVKSVEKLNLPTFLESFTYYGMDLTEANYKELASLDRLEEIYQIVDDEKQAEDVEKIRKKYSSEDSDDEDEEILDSDDEDDELLDYYVEYDRINKKLTINDYYQKEGTKYGAKQIIKQYKNKAVESLDYNLVVRMQVHNNIAKVDPVKDRDFPEDIFQFKDLITLTLAYQKEEQDRSWHTTYHKGTIKKGYLKKFTSVTQLTLKNIKLSQDNINDLATLSNLCTLTLDECEFNGLNFKPMEGLTNLKNLEIISRSGAYEYGGDIDGKILKYFKALDLLNIQGYEISQTNMNEICTLKHLNRLTYPVNKKIDTSCQKKLPLISLELIYYEHAMDGPDYDENLVPSVEKLNLPEGLEILKYRNLELTDNNYKEIVSLGQLYELGEVKIDETDYKDLKALRKKYSSSSSTPVISTNGKCGPKNGNTVCPSGKCCSKYGWCGTSDDHCKAGCQSEFGKCTPVISTNDKCGPKNGNTVCPSGKCCSKYGWCGTSDEYCKAGCQSEFGNCK